MLNDMLDQGLDFVLRNNFMDALSQRSQHKMHVFLLGFEVFNERAVERQKDQIVTPDHTSYQGHVDQLMSVLFVLAAHDVEELLCEGLRIVDDIDWHVVLCARVDLSLSQSPCCFLLLFLELLLLVFGLTHNSLLRTQVSRINSLILTIRQLFKRHGSLHQEMAGHHAAATGRCEASLSDDVDRTIISPHIPLVELNQQFQRFLGSLIGMLGDVGGDESADLLVDLVVLVVAVHASDVVEQVLVDHRAEFLILQPHLFQQEGNGGHGQQNVLGSKDHHASRALLPQIGVQAGTQFLHQSHGSTRNPAQNLREKLDRPGKEDKQLPKAFILLHGISLHLLKLHLEETEIVLHIAFVENGITGHLDGEIFQFLEHGIVDGLLIDFLH